MTSMYVVEYETFAVSTAAAVTWLAPSFPCTIYVSTDVGVYLLFNAGLSDADTGDFYLPPNTALTFIIGAGEDLSILGAATGVATVAIVNRGA